MTGHNNTSFIEVAVFFLILGFVRTSLKEQTFWEVGQRSLEDGF